MLYSWKNKVMIISLAYQKRDTGYAVLGDFAKRWWRTKAKSEEFYFIYFPWKTSDLSDHVCDVCRQSQKRSSEASPLSARHEASVVAETLTKSNLNNLAERDSAIQTSKTCLPLPSLWLLSISTASRRWTDNEMFGFFNSESCRRWL